MKKLTKLIFSCAAVAALTAAVGTAAMAETVNLSAVNSSGIAGTYDTETGVLTITGTGRTGDTQQTILVLNEDATTVAEGNILQVDQMADLTAQGVSFKLDTTKVTASEDGNTYHVRIGGDADQAFGKATFTLQSGGGGDITGGEKTFRNGDVNEDELIDIEDAGAILEYFVKADSDTNVGTAPAGTTVGDELTKKGTSDTFRNGDVNSDELIDIEDAGAILEYFVKADSDTNVGTAPAGTAVGDTITVIVPAAE